LQLAKELIQEAIGYSPDDASHWNVLGEIFRLSREPIEAIKAFQRAISIDPSFADVYSNLGNVYSDADDFENATAAYQKALSIDRCHVDALFNLGNMTFRAQRFSIALESYQKVLEVAPQHLGALNNYGLLLISLKQFDEADTVYHKLLALNPTFLDGVTSYAGMLHGIGKLPEALAVIERSIPLFATEQTLALRLRQGAILRELGKREEAMTAYRAALALAPRNEEAIGGVINMDVELGNFISARNRLNEECNRAPDNLHLQFARCFLELPVLYQDTNDIQKVRQRYKTELSNLAERIRNLSQDEVQVLQGLIGSSQPFFLPYQAMDDRELQASYGAMISSAMSRTLRLPLLEPRPAIEGRRLKVGFVSGFFRNHSNYKIPLRGWIKNLDPSQFQVFGYHTQHRIDSFTQEAQAACDTFVQGPKSLQEWVQTILDHHLDILIFPEIGMDPMTCRLACLRLAPHQATSWGHPTTSGLPTIDYFLSSDLMEPKGAEQYYSEALVRLPNLSFHYEPPTRAPVPIVRKDVGIRQKAFVYWCCQTNYKYLPQFDWVFPAIASEVPDAQFVFIQIQPASEASALLRSRLEKAFNEKGLKASDFVTYLPALEADQFAAVASLCDVALDAFEWSGCNSSLETLAQGIPIITCPGTFMRSRHTSAILEMIGCTETLASTPDKFVSLAVSLAKNPTKLKELRTQVQLSFHQALRDTKAIEGLQHTLIAWNSQE
jgi:predicted O-linked N-acetylglucosamine transferase (SPINDLY family)